MPKKIHTTSKSKSAAKTTTRSVRKTASKKVASKKATTSRKVAPKKQSRKTASQTTTKRAAASKAKTGTAAADKSSLVHATPDTAFWVTSGDILTNLQELKDALSAMERTVFTHHVNEEKNDFADWVEAVLRDETCATALRSCHTPQSAHATVVRCLKVYYR